MMKFPVEDILPLIPQRPPFVMVDKLLYADETITRSSFTILPDNVLVKHGLFQEAGLMENIAQTAALRAGYIASIKTEAVLNGFIGSVRDFEVFALPKVGDELKTEITIENQIFNVTILSGKVWCNEVLIACCEMKVFIGNG